MKLTSLILATKIDLKEVNYRKKRALTKMEHLKSFGKLSSFCYKQPKL